MATATRKRRRERLFQECGGICPMCSQPMVLPRRSNPYDGLFPNSATIDHLNDRYDLEKRLAPQTPEEIKANLGRTRVICRRCNMGLADEKTRQLPLWEKWRRCCFPKSPEKLLSRFVKEINRLRDIQKQQSQ